MLKAQLPGGTVGLMCLHRRRTRACRAGRFRVTLSGSLAQAHAQTQERKGREPSVQLVLAGWSGAGPAAKLTGRSHRTARG